MSEKVRTKKIAKEGEEQSIDQSLYCAMTLPAGKTEFYFFGIPLGMWDEAKKKKLTRTDTNMWCSGQLVAGQEFSIEGIRFKDRRVDRSTREHLMQYAHFFIRIADRDFFMYPYHLMDNFFYFVERRFTVPIRLQEYFNFGVHLRLDESLDNDIHLTCELMGKLQRPDRR